MNWLIRYLLNYLILIDQAANTVLGGAPNETVSERAAKARNAGRRWGCVLCHALDLVNPGHCDRSLAATIGERAIIPDGE